MEHTETKGLPTLRWIVKLVKHGICGILHALSMNLATVARVRVLPWQLPLKAGNPVWPYCIGQRFHGDRSCFFTDCQVTGKLNDQNGHCFQPTCQRERKYWRLRSVGSRCENSYSRLSLDLGRLWLESWSELQCLGPTKTDIVGFEKAFLCYQIPKRVTKSRRHDQTFEGRDLVSPWCTLLLLPPHFSKQISPTIVMHKRTIMYYMLGFHNIIHQPKLNQLFGHLICYLPILTYGVHTSLCIYNII